MNNFAPPLLPVLSLLLILILLLLLLLLFELDMDLVCATWREVLLGRVAGAQEERNSMYPSLHRAYEVQYWFIFWGSLLNSRYRYRPVRDTAKPPSYSKSNNIMNCGILKYGF